MSCRSNLLLPLSTFLLLLSLPLSFSLNFDGTLLLSFKYSVLTDPLSVLDSWDYNAATPCLWTGVACAAVVNNLGVVEQFRVVGLSLPNSKLAGTVPEYLGFIPHLRTLDLSGNFFNGTLPESIFNASELRVLDLSGNAFTGSVPEIAAGNLRAVNLSENALVGGVPRGVVSSRNLTTVSLRGNRLSGEIPAGIGSSLQVFDVSGNLLSGSLPAEFGGGSLRYLNLSSNQLTGAVPPGFASGIPANATIDLSFNRLSGEIPASAALLNQKAEAYAGNADLCGKPANKLCTAPSTLSAPPNANTTSPAAIAAIPKTIGSAPELGSATAASTTNNGAQITTQHGLKPGAVAGIAVVPLAAVGVLATLFLYIYQKKKTAASAAAAKDGSIPTAATAHEFKKDLEIKETTRTLPAWHCLTITNGEETSESTTSESDDGSNRVSGHPAVENPEPKKERMLVMVDGETELEAETLFKASAYVLGSSGATIVYKAVLQDGSAFAVRRIGESGGGRRRKEFENQLKAAAKLRHENLVRIRGFYWGDDEKLVICDYVSNGSLANVGCSKSLLNLLFIFCKFWYDIALCMIGFSLYLGVISINSLSESGYELKIFLKLTICWF